MGRKRSYAGQVTRIQDLEKQVATLITHNYLLQMTDRVNEDLREDWLRAGEALRLDVAALEQQVAEREFELEDAE